MLIMFIKLASQLINLNSINLISSHKFGIGGFIFNCSSSARTDCTIIIVVVLEATIMRSYEEFALIYLN